MIVLNAPNADEQITSQIDLSIHGALRDLVRLSEMQAFRMDGDIAITSGNRDYVLPADLMKIIEPGISFVTSDFRTLRYTTEQHVRTYGWERNQRSGLPEFYVLRGRKQYLGDWNIRLYPTPSDNRTIRVHYLALPDPLWAGRDESTVLDPRLPAEFSHAVVYGAVTHLPRYLNAQIDLAYYQGLWSQYIEDAKQYSVPVSGQSYQKVGYDSFGYSGLPLPYMWEPATIVPG